MNCILIFLIFSGVISAGNALLCKTCNITGPTVLNCDGQEEACENDTSFCITSLELNKLGDDPKYTTRRRCMKAEDRILCDNQLSLNASRFEYLLYSECCNQTDGCNSKEIEMPQVDQTPNGVQCEACFVEDSYDCTDSTLTNCTGNQKQCFNFKGDAARPGEPSKKYGFSGCVTEGACLCNLHDLPASKISDDAEYSCKYPSQ